jgi:hypothetical protein
LILSSNNVDKINPGNENSKNKYQKISIRGILEIFEDSIVSKNPRTPKKILKICSDKNCGAYCFCFNNYIKIEPFFNLY